MYKHKNSWLNYSVSFYLLLSLKFLLVEIVNSNTQKTIYLIRAWTSKQLVFSLKEYSLYTWIFLFLNPLYFTPSFYTFQILYRIIWCYSFFYLKSIFILTVLIYCAYEAEKSGLFCVDISLLSFSHYTLILLIVIFIILVLNLKKCFIVLHYSNSFLIITLPSCLVIAVNPAFSYNRTGPV